MNLYEILIFLCKMHTFPDPISCYTYHLCFLLFSLSFFSQKCNSGFTQGRPRPQGLNCQGAPRPSLDHRRSVEADEQRSDQRAGDDETVEERSSVGGRRRGRR